MKDVAKQLCKRVLASFGVLFVLLLIYVLSEPFVGSYLMRRWMHALTMPKNEQGVDWMDVAETFYAPINWAANGEHEWAYPYMDYVSYVQRIYPPVTPDADGMPNALKGAK